MKDALKNIFSSATKIVFVIIAIALVGFTAVGIIDGKDFLQIASMVFATYYARKPSDDTSSKIETKISDKL